MIILCIGFTGRREACVLVSQQDRLGKVCHSSAKVCQPNGKNGKLFVKILLGNDTRDIFVESSIDLQLIVYPPIPYLWNSSSHSHNLC
jgi:hypothetical protein